MSKVQLSANTRAADGLVLSDSQSFFSPVGYARHSNFARELRDVNPQTAPTYGGRFDFILPKAADCVGDVDLVLDIENSPVVAKDGSATVA